MPLLVRIILFFSLFLPVTAAPKPLEKFDNCTFVPADWADGDSFRIKTANGDEHTIRLYGVDCLEQFARDQNAPGPDFKIDPNFATRKQLIDLDGIGEILADRIIEKRKNAPFLKAEELLRVKGLNKPTLEKMRPHLVFP